VVAVSANPVRLDEVDWISLPLRIEIELHWDRFLEEETGDIAWVLALGIEFVLALETNIEEPSLEEIVLISETLMQPKRELRQHHCLWIPEEQQAALSAKESLHNRKAPTRRESLHPIGWFLF
jgi:hypothetical protein